MADPKESTLAGKLAIRFRKQHFAYERNRKCWMKYETQGPGIWREISDDEIAAHTDAALPRLCPDGYSARTLDGVVRLLKIRLGFTLKRPAHTLLPCLNGVLDLTTMDLRKYSPDDHFTWTLPYNYDAQATCPLTRKWLSETVLDDKETVEVLRAYLKAITTSRVDLQRYLELIGPGGRGKGTYLRIAQALVGQANTDVSNLKTLEGSRFETAGLVDKKLLILTDEERYSGSVATLKALTGEDTIRIERKHKDKAHANNLCMVLMAANEPILCPDYTSGLARRRLTVHFANQVKTRRTLLSLSSGTPSGELADELPGILNWVLSMPDDEMVRRLTTTTSTAQVATKVMILIETNPLAAWAEDCLMIGNDDAVTYIGVARRVQPDRLRDLPMDTFENEDKWLYANYCGWMQQAGCKGPVSKMRFSPLLLDLCREQLGLTNVFKPPRDEIGNHIVGIRFRTDEDGDIPGLITEALTKTLVLQDPVDSLNTQNQETVDSVDSVDLLKKLPIRAHREKSFPQRSPSTTGSTVSWAPAYSGSSKSSAPGIARVSNGYNPHYELDRWVYGKPRR